MVGARGKLNKELIEEAERLVKSGQDDIDVYNYLGISHETWYRWLREGENNKNRLTREFYETIKKAKASAVIRNVTIIQNSAQETWQAAAWWLERKYPERFGKKEKYEHTGKDGGAIEINSKQLREQILSRINQYSTDEGTGEGDKEDNE